MDMKNKSVPFLGFILFICFSCNSTKNLTASHAHATGTTTSEQIKEGERINGDQLVDELLAQRFNYNKAVIEDGFNSKRQFPKAISLINNTSLKTISFNGLDYLIKDDKVVGIKGIKLPPSTLSTITEKVAKLDQIQQYCCEKVNLEYQQKNRDLNTIKTFDRKYFAALNTLKNITSSIAAEAKKRNASVSIEMSLAKIKLPDIKLLGMKSKGTYVAKIE